MTNENKIENPPDRSRILTEQRNPRTNNLHKLSVDECVNVISAEDKTVFDAIDKAKSSIAEFIKKSEPGFIRGGRLIYIGAGTSGRLGVLDAAEIPPTFQEDPGRIVAVIAGGDTALRKSSEGKEDDFDGARKEIKNLNLEKDDTLLGIAAGGTTPYVLGALSYAKQIQRNILTGLLTCAPIPEQAEYLDHLITIETGPEVLTGSTRMKAGTATKLALNTISTTLMIRSGKAHKNLMVDVKATNAKLRDRAARIVSTLTGLSREESFAQIDLAGGAVKTAVVMRHCGLSQKEAESMLAANGNRLDKILENL